MTRLIQSCSLTLTVSAMLLAAAAVANAQPAEPYAAAFNQADRDADRRLTLEEYLAAGGDSKVATRDFKLFDFDSDGYLTRAEFAAIPTVADPLHRGSLPDPMLGVLEQAVTALDVSLGNWNERPEDEIDVRQFYSAVQDGADGPGLLPFEPAVADLDGNQRVSRDEARRFLQHTLGICRRDGRPLRHPDGRVVNNHLYLHIDENQNDRLEREEYLQRSFDGKKAEAEFQVGDADHDGVITCDEYFRMPGSASEDPIQQFRESDTNFDGRLDADELLAGTPEWKRNLATSVFPGFDLDKDGTLSLTEYRLTMQANMIAPWTNLRLDSDDDGKLSFPEFQWSGAQFPLLRLMFFHRLDTNQDHFLDQDEFRFRVRVPNEFFVLNADGTGWKPLFRFEGHPGCGSPAVSPDGQWLAFDGYTSRQQRNTKVFVMSLTEQKPQPIRSGMMPSWSNDGKKLCYSQSNSVWITNGDGSSLRIIGAGWGAQWSPDGTRIALTDSNARVIQLYHLQEDKVEPIFDGEKHGYQQISGNMTWSPDNRQLCFKGVKAENVQDVAIIRASADDPALKVRHTTKTHINGDFAWHPSGERVVFAMRSPERGVMQLYEFEPEAPEPPRLVIGQDASRNNLGACWSPDSKRLIVVSGDY